MPVERDPGKRRPPLIRFTSFVALGFFAATLLSWSIATWGPKWFPNGERLVAPMAMLVVFVGALRSALSTLLQAAAAIAIAVALHIAIYYAPLLYLLDASYNRIMLRKLAEIAGAGAASYALAVAVSIAITTFFNRKVKAE